MIKKNFYVLKSIMKKIKFGLNSYSRVLSFVLLIFLAVVSAESRTLNLPNFQNKTVAKTSQTNAPKKKKKKGKTKQKMIPTKTAFVPPSFWGATGIGLVVEENAVKIEYDCADGEIEQKLMLDKDGNFSVNGFYIPQHGGPVREDAPLERKLARFEGKVTDKTMTLIVTLAESKETVGKFVLERDKAPRIRRCL